MRILFVSGELTGSGLCQKLISEGNEVKLYIHKAPWKNCFTGLVEKIEDWRQELNWVGRNGIIIFDDVIFGTEQDELRSHGYVVVGSSAGGDLLELDRKLFQNVVQDYGMVSLPSYGFSEINEAIKFIRDNPKRWVLKQTSHVSSLNYIGHLDNGADVIRVLERYEKRCISPVYLQEFVNGIEVGVARYFNGSDWVGPVEINHEHKKLNDGDVGPLTPEMGTVLWYTDENVPLFKKTLAKLKPYLKKIDFRGDIDINFIINENNIWPLEATPRFGAPSTQLHVELHKSPWSDFLWAIGTKKKFDLDYHGGFGVVVSVVLPPFPYEPDTLKRNGAAGFDKRLIKFDTTFSESDYEHVHFEEVSKINNQHVWSGTFGLVLHVTDNDVDLSQAKQKVYNRLKKIDLPGMYFRKDIGDRVYSTDIPLLKQWGWI